MDSTPGQHKDKAHQIRYVFLYTKRRVSRVSMHMCEMFPGGAARATLPFPYATEGAQAEADCTTSHGHAANITITNQTFVSKLGPSPPRAVNDHHPPQPPMGNHRIHFAANTNTPHSRSRHPLGHNNQTARTCTDADAHAHSHAYAHSSSTVPADRASKPCTPQHATKPCSH